MKTLSGIYNNGKIILSEKLLPKIRAKVIVVLDDTTPIKELKKTSNQRRYKELDGIWEDRDDIVDSSKWVTKQRKLLNTRFK